MNFKLLIRDDEPQITRLFTETFTHSEGPEEGELIGHLAKELAHLIDQKEVYCFAAVTVQSIQGIIFFSQLDYQTEESVFMLAPVAVHPDFQAQGIGQALIKYGLSALKNLKVEIAVTYGDPNFYSKVGFSPITEATLQAPMPLSMPQGWLAQSLKDSTAPIKSLHTKPKCVVPFQNPDYW